MATRRNIRDAFFSQLQTAAVGTHTVDYGAEGTDTVTVESDDIGLPGAFDLEDPLPKIVYRETYRNIPYNGAGSGPHFVERDSSGDVLKEIWREYIEAQFIVEVRTDDELQKEVIYETIRGSFGKYQFRDLANPANDLHKDVFHVEVLDAQDADSPATETPIRGETLEIRLSFHRDFYIATAGTVGADGGELGTEDPIAQINREVDADLDDATTGLTSTTT